MEKFETIILPEVIINPHSHGRDFFEIYKSSLKQVMVEARKGLIDISCFMPNTNPALINIFNLRMYLFFIEMVQEELQEYYPQYVFFGVTDDNLDECREAIKLPQVLGFKIYPPKVTTGGDQIGVSSDEVIKEVMILARNEDKAVEVHCDNPAVIMMEGNTIKAEVTDIERILRIAEEFPGVKITICHVSCRESAELIIAAQKKGMNVILELAPHYLWFDNEGTNWNPCLPAIFYHCFNNLRGPADRFFLQSLLLRDDVKVMIGADDARHTREEKLEKGFGGIPSNMEMVPVLCTLAKKIGISDVRLGDLLCFNAADHLGISLPRSFTQYRLEERIVNYDYNNGKVVNPWRGFKLLFPMTIE